MRPLWRHAPVLLRAPVEGLLLSAIGTAPFGVLLGLNLQTSPAVPWSAAPGALWLWFFWRWLGGRGWPHSTSEARRERRRAIGLSRQAWIWSLSAGVLGLSALELAGRAIEHFARAPATGPEQLAQLPLLTLAVAIVMTSLSAALVEEAAFRGYMQQPLERRHGPVLAILVVGLVFALAHTTHGWMGWALVPAFVLSSVVFGALAYLSRSILPGAVLHFAVDVAAIVLGAVRGGAGAQPTDPGLTGADASFWIQLGSGLACAAGSFAAFRRLARC